MRRRLGVGAYKGDDLRTSKKQAAKQTRRRRRLENNHGHRHARRARRASFTRSAEHRVRDFNIKRSLSARRLRSDIKVVLAVGVSTPSHTLGGHTRRMGGSGALRPSSRVKALESFGRGRVITKNYTPIRIGLAGCDTALSIGTLRGASRFRDGALWKVVFVLRSSSVRRMHPAPSGATLCLLW